MRLPARRIASTALCATLLAGITGPAAVAADSSRERTHAASRAPVPGADTVLAQTKSLANLGAVLTPATDLLNQALQNGQLTPDQAQKLVDAVKAAIAQVSAAAPAAPSLPVSPSLTKHGAAGEEGAAGEDGKAPKAKDLQGDALAALQKAVDALLAAVTSGDVSKVLPAAAAVVTGLVNFVAATVLGGGLPAPDLPGLPALPSLPVPAPSLPVPAPSLPVTTPALPTS
ncbi:hypothetical protein ACFC09_10620 [Streptomyces sp. NPDC056161]|uniref:hypothetical protein n=1 Tax=Streptomyces sp. NPDC056161 TaxID=3345732 RepID=UPI0035E2976D